MSSEELLKVPDSAHNVSIVGVGCGRTSTVGVPNGVDIFKEGKRYLNVVVEKDNGWADLFLVSADEPEFIPPLPRPLTDCEKLNLLNEAKNHWDDITHEFVSKCDPDHCMNREKCPIYNKTFPSSPPDYTQLIAY